MGSVVRLPVDYSGAACSLRTAKRAAGVPAGSRWIELRWNVGPPLSPPLPTLRQRGGRHDERAASELLRPASRREALGAEGGFIPSRRPTWVILPWRGQGWVRHETSRRARGVRRRNGRTGHAGDTSGVAGARCPVRRSSASAEGQVVTGGQFVARAAFVREASRQRSRAVAPSRGVRTRARSPERSRVERGG